MKSFTYEPQAKNEAGALTVWSYEPRVRWSKTDGRGNLTFGAQQQNDLQEWRKNLDLIRQRTAA